MRDKLRKILKVLSIILPPTIGYLWLRHAISDGVYRGQWQHKPLTEPELEDLVKNIKELSECNEYTVALQYTNKGNSYIIATTDSDKTIYGICTRY